MPNQRHALATASGLPLTALVTAILTDYAAKHKPPSEQDEQ